VAVGTFTMLGVVTLLGRTLTLSEFGLYGLLISIPAYVLILQASVEVAAIRALARAEAQEQRDQALTTALALYACFGALASVLIVFGGWALLGVFDVSPALHADARHGLVLLGAINLLSWPAKTAQDLLRGSQRFVPAAVVEAVAYVVFGIATTTAILLGAPLWIVVGLGGSLPLLIGLVAVVALLRLRLGFRVRPSTLSLPYTRSFLSISSYLFVVGIADLVIYSFDRTILGAFRPVATVGLYEGPVRAHNLVRQVQGTLATTVIPAAVALIATDDRERLRDLLVRGTRYLMLATVPLTVTFMVLAGPILDVWLGPRFRPAATAMTILVSYWLIGVGSSVGGAMLIAAGRARLIAIFASCVALVSLGLSLALTPILGLNGVVLGTSAANFAMVPFIIWVYCRTFEVPVRVLVLNAILPAYATGAALALVEFSGRALLPLGRPQVLLALIGLGLTGYAAIVYSAWLTAGERRLIRTLATGARRRFMASRPAFRSG